MNDNYHSLSYHIDTCWLLWLLLQMSSPTSVADSDDEVVISQVGDKGVFTMNRPKVLNALNVSMIQRMTAQLKVSFM